MKYVPCARPLRMLWSLCAISAVVTSALAGIPQPAAADEAGASDDSAAAPKKLAAPRGRPQPATAQEGEPQNATRGRKPDVDGAGSAKAHVRAAKPAAAESAAVEEEGADPALAAEAELPDKPAGKKPLPRHARSASDPPAAAGKAVADLPKADVNLFEMASEAQTEPAVEEAPKRKLRRAAPEKAAPRSKPDRAARKAARLSGAQGRQPTAEYRKLRDGWHAPIVPEVEPVTIVDASGRIPLQIVPVNGGDKVVMTPERDDGGFREEDLARAARAFCPQGVKGQHPIAPHLVDLVYRAMRHFEAPLVRLVSGYRKDRAGSRHTQGRAIDMVIPGVTNEQLAEYVRQFGFVGVGIYPKSGFVHLDVREKSYFWIDMSLPDERSRPQPMLGDTAAEFDRAAQARGETPDAFVPNNDREDKAAGRSYAKRAQRRRAAAERKAELATD